MPEYELMRRIQIELSQLGHRVFRNNVGSFEDKRGAWIRVGLCEGSSDLIGWTRTGRFLAVEVKAPGARTKADRLDKQRAFVDAVNRSGGVGLFASSVEEAVAKVEEAIA